MSEFTNVAVQTVTAGQNVLFNETPVRGNGCVRHRDGSGIVSLSGNTAQCRAQYKVTFGGNIAVATGGTAGAISIALSLDGEPLGSATAISVPAAIGDFSNVFVAVFVDVPRGCCATIAVENTSTQAIDVQNANLIVERIE